jgi:hypothetical protein
LSTIAIDFDGTLAAEGNGIEPGTGEPLPGAIDFLSDLDEAGFTIVIFSRTAAYAPERIERWMSAYASWVPVKITNVKPDAFAYLDNRAIWFDGEYPSMELLKGLAGD